MSHPPSFPKDVQQAKLFGFANLGNTCFLNSVLQALCRTPPLLQEFLRQPPSALVYREGSKKPALVQAFVTLLHEVWGPTTQHGQVHLPTAFVRTLASTCKTCDDDWFQPRQQADAAECLQYILDALHDALYRTVRITVHGQARTPEHVSQLKALHSWSTFFQREYSPIVKHFYGQNQIRIQCEGCGTISERFEPWMMMKLPIPGGDTPGAAVPTLDTCLVAHHAPEHIEGYQCDTCKSPQKAAIQTRISKLPNILILTLKRFTNAGHKICGTVAWNPNSVDFKSWIAFQRCPFTEVPMTADITEYETFAVLEHLGSARSGHYHMYNRIPNTDQWMDLDDDCVGACALRTNKDVVTPDAYILMMMPRAARQGMLESAEVALRVHHQHQHQHQHQNPGPK